MPKTRLPKTRKLSREGLDFIKRHEGYEEKIYRCPAGEPTIGYGHLLRPGEAERYRRGIDAVEAERLLIADVAIAERAVCDLIDATLSQPQFDALVSFAYNLGSENLRRSTLRRRLNEGDYDGVPDELKRWVYAGGKRLAGLERRRGEEAALFLRGMRDDGDDGGRPASA